MSIKYRLSKSLLPKLQAVRLQKNEINPFECDISEEDINEENIFILLIDGK